MTLTGNRRSAPSSTASKEVSTNGTPHSPWPAILEKLPDYEPDTLVLSLEFYRESVVRRVVDDHGHVTVSLVDIAEVARERDIIVLSDEIYSRLLYTGQHESIARLDGMLERTILLDGWSKTWAMTGWRLGFGVFPLELVPHVERLISNSVSCTASFAQQAAIVALEGPQDAVDRMLVEFTARRAAIVRGLNSLPGVRCLEPDGAFYAFPNISGSGISSRELADRLLEEAGVAGCGTLCRCWTSGSGKE